MTKLEVIPYHPDHLARFTAQPNQQGEVPKVVMTYALSVVAGDEILALVGGFLFAPGIIHVWALLSTQVRKYRFSFHKECLKMLEFYREKDKPRRIQMDVRLDFPRAQRWAEALGFEKEGIMRKYSPDGMAHYMYARVF